MAYTPTKQEFLVIFAATLIVISAVFATLWVSGFFQQQFSSNKETGYKNVTATDAQLACEAHTSNQFGSSLDRMVVDDHSSRYEHKSGTYKVFIKAEVGGDRKTPAANYYVSCFVAGKNGAVIDFDAFEDKEIKAEAIRKKDTNLFGWPK